MSADPRREFLDTNVLVYAHDLDAGAKRVAAIQLVERTIEEGTAALSTQVLSEFFVTVTRKRAQPLPVEAATAALAGLARLAVHSPDAGDVLAAIDIHQRHGISYWDALILQSAGEMSCSTVWTEDLAERQYDGVTVRNPFGVAK